MAAYDQGLIDLRCERLIGVAHCVASHGLQKDAVFRVNKITISAAAGPCSLERSLGVGSDLRWVPLGA
jgi:hypothetical protein